MLAVVFAQEGTEEAANPILPVIPEMIWGAIAFFSLWALVKFVLLPPVQKTMEERASKIRSDRDAAEVARSRIDTAQSEAKDQLADARNEAAAIVDAARAEAEAERATVMARAEEQAAAIRAEAEAEIETARAEALSGMQPQVAELVADAASRVLGRPVEASTARPVVDRLMTNPN